MTDRRQAPRVTARLSVDHIVSDQDHCRCETLDLSLDGISVARPAGETWPEPRFVWLELQLPEGAPIRALAEGRRPIEHRGDAAARGFWIKYINPRDRRRYEAFVRGVCGVA